MPITISEIRSKFPMYDNVDDSQLVIGLHRKFYSDIPFGEFNKSIIYDKKPDATEGMSGFDKFAAGTGKAIVDTGRGIGQMLNLVSRDDVAESRKLDKSLMESGAGQAGNLFGNLAVNLPLAFVPGANTLKGAAMIGAATGLVQPSESTEETIKNVVLGGAVGGGSILAGRGLASGYQAASGLLRPLTEKGQRQIASEVLKASATDAAKAAKNLRGASPLVKGSMPTVGQVADDAGLAQLERTLLNNPESAGPLQRAYEAQRAARQTALADVAGTPEYRSLIEEGRRVFANEDYAKAFADGIDVEMAKAMKPQIDSLMRRPSLKSAVNEAKMLASERDIKLTNMGSIEGMDWLKKALDNKISRASQPGSSIGKEELRGLMQTKDDLMAVMEQIAPSYKAANDNFAKMSRQINASDVAADLQKRLYKNAEWGSGKEMGNTYMTELSNALESVKKQTGMNKSLRDVMNEGDIKTLENIARDLARKEKGQNLGKAVGSPTMQNMLGQNLIRRIAGPLGVPESLAENSILNTLSRPYSFAMQYSQPKIAGLLAESMVDPLAAQSLLSLTAAPSRIGMRAMQAEKYLPGLGLVSIQGQ